MRGNVRRKGDRKIKKILSIHEKKTKMEKMYRKLMST
jgi:hypothetical protein